MKSYFHKDKYKSNKLSSARKNCKCSNRKKYYYNNKDVEIKKRIDWRQNNLQIARETEKRRREIPKNKLIDSQRNRVYMILKGHKVKSTPEYLGCSYNFLIEWIKYQCDLQSLDFSDYAKVCQIDHTIPCASVDINNENEVQRCFNWINLRPMLSKENLNKKDKVDKRLYLLQEIKAFHFNKFIFNSSL